MLLVALEHVIVAAARVAADAGCGLPLFSTDALIVCVLPAEALVLGAFGVGEAASCCANNVRPTRKQPNNAVRFKVMF